MDKGEDPMRSRSLSRIGPLVALAILTLVAMPSMASAAGNVWAPMGAIVWPHDLQGNATTVASSQMVNMSVWPANTVRCNQMPDGPASLMMDQDNETYKIITCAPTLLKRTVNGATLPSLELND